MMALLCAPIIEAHGREKVYPYRKGDRLPNTNTAVYDDDTHGGEGAKRAQAAVANAFAAKEAAAMKAPTSLATPVSFVLTRALALFD
jgi:hypothetical protein